MLCISASVLWARCEVAARGHARDFILKGSSMLKM